MRLLTGREPIVISEASRGQTSPHGPRADHNWTRFARHLHLDATALGSRYLVRTRSPVQFRVWAPCKNRRHDVRGRVPARLYVVQLLRAITKNIQGSRGTESVGPTTQRRSCDACRDGAHEGTHEGNDGYPKARLLVKVISSLVTNSSNAVWPSWVARRACWIARPMSPGSSIRSAHAPIALAISA